jgi:hypothetical protein
LSLKTGESGISGIRSIHGTPIFAIRLTWLFEVSESIKACFEQDLNERYPAFQKVSETID